MRRSLSVLALAGALLAAAPALAPATAQAEDLPNVKWSFDGIFGTYDRAALQRGFQVYKEVCSACHSMNLLYYRNLAGIGLDENQIKAIAASVQVPGGTNDNGEPIERPGLPSDHFKPPFPNEKAARAANGGALPPDQSLLEKAREGGSDYIYGILTGYKEAPKDVKLANGMYYNEYFPGHQIAMPQPLHDDAVTYADGTKATLQQEAHDVTTFLTWASEPSMEVRKRMGVKVVLFLFFMTGLTYAVKRRVWSGVH